MSYSEDPSAKNIKSDTIAVEIPVDTESVHSQHGFVRNFMDSFKRAEPQEQTIREEKLENGLETARTNDYNATQKKMKQTMKSRHITMISLGTGIGTGLLVANGKALHFGGPGGLIIGYVTTSTMLYCVIQACCELGVSYATLPGNYNSYPSFLVDSGFNFAVAWVYGLQWAIVLPLELVTSSMTIKYWNDSINPDVFVAIFYCFIVFIHFFGSQGYAESEFIFNSCKVLMMVGFIIMGISVNCGAGKSGYIGGKYWHTPGAFVGEKAIDHFKGICSVWVQSAFAYGGSEFIALTAAEQTNPRKSVPKATKRWLYRVLIVFLTPITLVGFLVPYDSPLLLGSPGQAASHASPFVIAAASHGVKVVPHIINAVILISVISVGNSAFYSAPRILLSLAEQGMGPKAFTYVDRKGRPLVTMLFVAIFGLISFVAASDNEETVFTWLSAIVSLSQLFTWSAISLSHIRFRDAMKAQGRSLGELGYKANTGYWGSWYAIAFNIIVLAAQFWVAIAPIGNGGKLDVNNFFQNYLAFPVLVFFYFGYKLWFRDWKLFIPADKVDLESHRKIFDADLIKQEDFEHKEKIKNSSLWVRALDFWC